MELYFLDRLRQAVAVREAYASRQEVEPQLLRLLHKTVFALYCDCLDAGLGEEARGLLYPRHDLAEMEPSLTAD